jgi:hypothetical protein
MTRFIKCKHMHRNGHEHDLAIILKRKKHDLAIKCFPSFPFTHLSHQVWFSLLNRFVLN